eukprot:Nk52_evm2s2531 gene=Nk52_evmTU2s2531
MADQSKAGNDRKTTGSHRAQHMHKKQSPDKNIVVYLCQREIVDRIESVDPLQGFILLDKTVMFSKVYVRFQSVLKYRKEKCGKEASLVLFSNIVDLYPSYQGYELQNEDMEVYAQSEADKQQKAPVSFCIPVPVGLRDSISSLCMSSQSKSYSAHYELAFFYGNSPMIDAVTKKKMARYMIRKLSIVRRDGVSYMGNQLTGSERGLEVHPEDPSCMADGAEEDVEQHSTVKKTMLFSRTSIELDVRTDRSLYYCDGDTVKLTVGISNNKSNAEVKSIAATLVQYVAVYFPKSNRDNYENFKSEEDMDTDRPRRASTNSKAKAGDSSRGKKPRAGSFSSSVSQIEGCYVKDTFKKEISSVDASSEFTDSCSAKVHTVGAKKRGSVVSGLVSLSIPSTVSPKTAQAEWDGCALLGKIKEEDTGLAASTRDDLTFNYSIPGISVRYGIRVTAHMVRGSSVTCKVPVKLAYRNQLDFDGSLRTTHAFTALAGYSGIPSIVINMPHSDNEFEDGEDFM